MSQEEFVFVCKKCGDEIGIKYEPPKQEPVAWMDSEGFVYRYQETRPVKANIPLYTAPPSNLEAYMFGVLEGRGSQAFESDLVKSAPRELSDEEIDDIIQFLNQSRVSWSGNEFIKEAMRLAIKKASEK